MNTKRKPTDAPRRPVVIFRKSPDAPRAWLFILHRPRPDAEKRDGSSAAESGDGRQ